MALPSISVIISAVTSGLTHGLQTAHNALQSFSSSIHSVFTGAASAITSLSAKLFPVLEVAKTIGGAIAGVGSTIIDFGGSAVKAAADMESMQQGLEFVFSKQLNGDIDTAKAKTDLLISSMITLGETSNYNSSQLLPMARSWANIGDSAETAIAKMQTIVDVGSAYNLTEEEMQRVNLALTQMQMKGKMQAEEMMQLTEAGVPAWQILSQAMGLSTAELQDMASKGQLTQEAMAALFTGMQEQFGGAAKNAGETINSMFANITEKVDNSMSTIGALITQGLDLKGALKKVSSFTDGFVEHLNNIKTHAENVGVGEAIANELNSMGLYGVADFVEAVIQSFENIWTTIEAFLIPAIERFGGSFDAAGNASAQVCALVEGAIEFVIIALSGVIDIINIIITAWGMWWDFVCSFWSGVADGISWLCNFMAQTFGGVFNWISESWEKLRVFLSHPLDFVINVIWFDTKTGESTEANKMTDSGNSGLGAAPTFSVDMFSGGGAPELPSVGGALGGGGGGSRGGGGSGGGGRASEKEAPWEGKSDFLAEVAEQVDEAARDMVASAKKAANDAKNVIVPVLDTLKNDELGKALQEAFSGGRIEKTKTAEIQLAISAITKDDKLDTYGKILQDAKDKAQKVGEEMQKWDKYLAEVNETAAEYGENGKQTLKYLEQRESALKRIADLEEKIVRGKGDENTEAEIGKLKGKLIRDTAQYEMDKSAALEEQQKANDARAQMEQQAADTKKQIWEQANAEIYSRESALKAAQEQQDKANNATSLDEYMALMDAKDERTGQSYASMLAQEEALNAQRQVWHEQLMLNAMEWADYMAMTFASLNQQLVDGLSSGLADCIVKGKSLGEVLQNLAANLLQTLINNVLKKWLTGLIGIGAQQKTNAIQEITTAKTVAAAEKLKTGAMIQNAVAAKLAAFPFIPAFTIAGEVVAAVKMAGAAGFATGGLVSGAGTSTSDSIPAMLSNGEFVLRADAVQRIGTPALYALNEGKTLHYSEGGQVGKASTGGAAVGSPNVTLNVSALDSAGFEGFLLRGGLDTIRQALFENNRNFGATAGVF